MSQRQRRADRLARHHDRATGVLVPWRCREDRPELGGPCAVDGEEVGAAAAWEAWRAHWLEEHHTRRKIR